jgi:hypothetical protein
MCQQVLYVPVRHGSEAFVEYRGYARVEAGVGARQDWRVGVEVPVHPHAVAEWHPRLVLQGELDAVICF